MSHSQFRRTKTYTETCMDESLRQAYDYWQDQPGSISRIVSQMQHNPTVFDSRSNIVDFRKPKFTEAKIWLRNSNNKKNTSDFRFHWKAEIAIASFSYVAQRDYRRTRSMRIQSTPSVQMQDPITQLANEFATNLGLHLPSELSGSTAT